MGNINISKSRILHHNKSYFIYQIKHLQNRIMLIGSISVNKTNYQQQFITFSKISWKLILQFKGQKIKQTTKHSKNANIQQTDWKKHLAQAIKKHSLDTYKLTQLTPKNIQSLYQKISLKYKIDESSRMIWYQNELRLFIWLIITSQGIFSLSPIHYKEEHFKLLSEPFYGVHEDLFSYQFKFAFCPQLYRPWQVEENQLLSQIIKYSFQTSWSLIAKQLFFISNKKYFRTPQTCRQRWHNHLDDRKVRGNWSMQQDLLLIKFILSEGKRWSVISKKMGQTRTQHMVKNRFQTILRKQFGSKKRSFHLSAQFQFCKQLLKKLSDKLNNITQKQDSQVSNNQRNHLVIGGTYQSQEGVDYEINQQPQKNNMISQIKNHQLNDLQQESFVEVKQNDNILDQSINLQENRKQIIFPESFEDWNQKNYLSKIIHLQFQVPQFIEQTFFIKQNELLD